MLARKIVAQVNPRAEIVSKDARVRPEKSEVMRLVASNEKAKELLGWSPQVSLDEGLARTIEFVKAHPDLYRPEEYTI